MLTVSSSVFSGKNVEAVTVVTNLVLSAPIRALFDYSYKSYSKVMLKFKRKSSAKVQTVRIAFGMNVANKDLPSFGCYKILISKYIIID